MSRLSPTKECQGPPRFWTGERRARACRRPDSRLGGRIGTRPATMMPGSQQQNMCRASESHTGQRRTSPQMAILGPAWFHMSGMASKSRYSQVGLGRARVWGDNSSMDAMPVSQPSFGQFRGFSRSPDQTRSLELHEALVVSAENNCRREASGLGLIRMRPHQKFEQPP